MTLATTRSFVGVAKEVTKGTYVAPTFFVPARDLDPEDEILYLEDKGQRGSAVEVYNMLPGVKRSMYGWGGDVFPDTIGILLLGLMGEVATTVASPLNTHNFTVLNTGDQQPPALSIADLSNPGTNARGYPGQQVEELSFTYEAEGFLEYTMKSKGFPSADQSAPVAAFSTVPPVVAWEGVASLGGAGNTKLVSGEFVLSRPVTHRHNVAGSQSPYRVWAGPLRATAKAKFLVDDEAELDRFLNDTKGEFKVTFTQPGAGALAKVIEFRYTNAAFISPTKIVRGTDAIEVEASVEGIANTTDVGVSAGFGPARVQLKNETAAY